MKILPINADSGSRHGRANNQIRVCHGKIVKRFGIPEKQLHFQRELAFYRWCFNRRIRQVPRLLNHSEKTQEIQIERIAGVEPLQMTSEILHQTSRFVAELKDPVVNRSLPAAGEAILNPEDLSLHLRQRWRQIGTRGKYHPEGLDGKLNQILCTLSDHPVEIGCILANPSDLGLHNMFLRGEEVIFYDFEYAGKDSYLKCVMDFCMHPANGLSIKKLKVVHKQFSDALRLDPISIPDTVVQAFCLWWVLRLLNSLKEEVIAHRVHTGVLPTLQISSYIEQRYEQSKRFWRLARFC